MLYKFLRLNDKNKIISNSGKLKHWKIGIWKKHKGSIELCMSGFHASERPYDAFSYVQGEVLAIVEVDGKQIKSNDKSVHQKMRIVKAYKWTKKDSVEFALYAAEKVIGIWKKKYPNDKQVREAINSAKNWLKNPTEENRQAAWAAGAAARAAARAAGAAEAAEAADGAAEAAAWAAWAAGAADRAAGAAEAAEAAARAAARAAGAAEAAYEKVINECNDWMVRRIKKLEEIK